MRRSEILTPARLREIEARYASDPDIALLTTEIRVLRVRVRELEGQFVRPSGNAEANQERNERQQDDAFAARWEE